MGAVSETTAIAMSLTVFVTVLFIYVYMILGTWNLARQLEVSTDIVTTQTHLIMGLTTLKMVDYGRFEIPTPPGRVVISGIELKREEGTNYILMTGNCKTKKLVFAEVPFEIHLFSETNNTSSNECILNGTKEEVNLTCQSIQYT